MIYLVEDDESIRELVIYTLKSQGFQMTQFGIMSHLVFMKIRSMMMLSGKPWKRKNLHFCSLM